MRTDMRGFIVEPHVSRPAAERPAATAIRVDEDPSTPARSSRSLGIALVEPSEHCGTAGALCLVPKARIELCCSLHGKQAYPSVLEWNAFYILSQGSDDFGA